MFELLERNHFKPIREKHAKNLFKQLIKAVLYLHKKGIVHRDLKLENIVLQSNFKKLKIIDFGLCEVGTDCKCTSTEWAGEHTNVTRLISKEVQTTPLLRYFIIYLILFVKLTFGLLVPSINRISNS